LHLLAVKNENIYF